MVRRKQDMNPFVKTTLLYDSIPFALGRGYCRGGYSVKWITMGNKAISLKRQWIVWNPLAKNKLVTCSTDTYATTGYDERSILQHHFTGTALIAKFMGPTWGPHGADRTQVGPMLAPWTLLSGWCNQPYHYHQRNVNGSFKNTSHWNINEKRNFIGNYLFIFVHINEIQRTVM